MQIADTLAFLLGAWDLDRSIENHRTGAQVTFTGRANLTETRARGGCAAAGRARYEETGELILGSYRGTANRTLEYVRLEDASIRVCFADGRPFIDVDLRDGGCTCTHDCGEDLYEISVAVSSHDSVEERWRVRGPDKHYDAVTRLSRVSSGNGRARLRIVG